MTIGDIVYKEYLEHILHEEYVEYYTAFDEATHLDTIQSVIQCINERHGVIEPTNPSDYDQACLNAIQLGDRALSDKAYELSVYLTERYKKTALNHIFTITLYFRHNTLCHYLNIPNLYEYKLEHYVRFFEILPEQREQVYMHYGMYLLSKQRYKESFPYTVVLNRVDVPHLNIHPFTMSGFKPYDKNKTLLVYMSGGLGDNIMYSRFIRRLCEKNPDNQVLFLVYDGLYWIYETLYALPNLKIMSFCDRDKLPHFDYHVNIAYLYALLKLDYNDIYIEYFPSLPYYPSSQSFKDHILIQWKGSALNRHEEHNRQMKLELWAPFLERHRCISIAKDLTAAEKILLKRYGVIHLDLDEHESYRHSLPIIQSVSHVISTDTSLVHLCGTLNIPCTTLLTAGCDWRWGTEATTRWYPNMRLLRQKRALDWSNVVDELLVIPIHR